MAGQLEYNSRRAFLGFLQKKRGALDHYRGKWYVTGALLHKKGRAMAAFFT
jgi:hypothetical protein